MNNIFKKILTFYFKCIIFSIFAIFNTVHSTSADYVVRGKTVIDLRNGLEWMRCSHGQNYDNEKCFGNVVRLNQKQVEVVLKKLNLEGNGFWRLPSKKELEMILCNECDPPKINEIIFPSTAKEPYWTGQKNWISPKNYWSVNFMTGYSYGRFFPQKELAIRFVKNRQK